MKSIGKSTVFTDRDKPEAGNDRIEAEVNGIRIVGTGRAVPKRILTNDDLSRMMDTNDEWIRTRTGIRERRICEDETTVSLAAEAAKRAVEAACEQWKNATCESAVCGGRDTEEAQDVQKETAVQYVKNEIGVILVATTTPDYAFPSVACLVQKELGLPDEVMSFDISAACSGFLYGLDICRGLLANAKKRFALVIGSEQLSRIADYTDRGSCILFGDGAGAAVVELSDRLYVQRQWSRGDMEALRCLGVGNDNAKLFMQGNKVFKFAVTALQQGVEQVLADAGLTMEDIDHVICHQANLRIIEHVQKKYPEHAEKFYVNIDRYGNTSAASIPIAIDEMRRSGVLPEGSRVICIGFGAGFTWSAVLFEV